MGDDHREKRLRLIEDTLGKWHVGPLDPQLTRACLNALETIPVPDGWDVDHLGLTPDQKIAIDRTLRECTIIKALALGGDAET